jgi:hypothetical protein
MGVTRELFCKACVWHTKTGRAFARPVALAESCELTAEGCLLVFIARVFHSRGQIESYKVEAGLSRPRTLEAHDVLVALGAGL